MVAAAVIGGDDDGVEVDGVPATVRQLEIELHELATGKHARPVAGPTCLLAPVIVNTVLSPYLTGAENDSASAETDGSLGWPGRNTLLGAR